MRKMDEMELAISLRAIRWAYLFTVLALFGWGLWDSIQQGVMTLPLYLVILQNLVYFIALQIFKMRAGDQQGKTSLIACGIMTLVLLLGFGVLLYFSME